MMRLHARSLVVGIFAAGLLSVPGPSDAAIFTLDDNQIAIGGGPAVAFNGSIAWEAGDPDFDVDGWSINLDAPLTYDDTDFIDFLRVFDAGDPLQAGVMFTVSAPGLTVPGVYTGSLTITANQGTFLLGTQDFTVEVRQSQVPEPATLALIGAGLLGVATARRRQRR
jgi:hypothetical protein